MAIDPNLQNRIAIGRQKALQMGYRPEQVDNYIKQKFGDVAPARPTGFGGMISNIANTALGLPKLALGGLYELPRFLKAQRGDYSGYVDTTTGATKQNPFLTEREMGKYNVKDNGFGGAGIDLLKRSAGTFAAAAPFAAAVPSGILASKLAMGAAKPALGAFTGGALASAGQEFAQEDSTLGSVATAGLTGGVLSKGLSMTPSLIQRLRGIGKTAGEITPEAASTVRPPTTLQTMGSNIRRNVLNPQAKATPFYAEEIQGLQDVANQVGLKGSSSQQLKQMPTIFRKIESNIKGLLKGKPQISLKDATNDFAEELTKTNYLGDKKIYKDSVDAMLKRIKATGVKGSSDLTSLYNLKSELRNELGNVFTKIEKGTALSPMEETRYALWSSLKKTIDRLAPEVRGLNNTEHGLFEISKGLVEQTKKGSPIKLPVVGAVPGTKEIAERGMDLAGRTLEKGVKLPTITPQVKTLVSRAASGIPIERIPQGAITPASIAGGMAASSYRGTPRDQGGIPAQQITSSTGQPASTGVQVGGMDLTPEKIQRAMLLDYQTTGGRNIATLTKMLDVVEKVQKLQGGGGKTLTSASAIALSDIKNSSNMLSGLLQSFQSGQFDSIVGPLKGRARSINPYDTDAQVFDSQMRTVAQVVGKALEGGVLRAEDVPKYRKILPQITDTRAVALGKIKSVMKLLEDKRATSEEYLQQVGYDPYGGMTAGQLVK